MGMFDELRCKYPLPVPGANDLLYQTKDTPEQFLDMYEIREDGTLWHEAYDIEDPNAPPGSILSLCGMFTRVNQRWEPCCLTDYVRFYGGHGVGIELAWRAHFVDGKLQDIKQIV